MTSHELKLIILIKSFELLIVQVKRLPNVHRHSFGAKMSPCQFKVIVFMKSFEGLSAQAKGNPNVLKH